MFSPRVVNDSYDKRQPNESSANKNESENEEMNWLKKTKSERG